MWSETRSSQELAPNNWRRWACKGLWGALKGRRGSCLTMGLPTELGPRRALRRIVGCRHMDPANRGGLDGANARVGAGKRRSELGRKEKKEKHVINWNWLDCNCQFHKSSSSTCASTIHIHIHIHIHTSCPSPDCLRTSTTTTYTHSSPIYHFPPTLSLSTVYCHSPLLD